MPVLIDASFLVAFDNSIDVHHQKARALWKKIERGDYGAYFISDYIFDEVMGVAMRKVGKKRAIALGQHLLKSVPLINIDRHIFDEAWKIFTNEKINLNLSFTDCTNIVLLNLIKTTYIVTFDREFREVPNVEVLDG